MKYLLLAFLIATPLSAEPLKLADIMKMQKRSLDLLSLIALQGKDAPYVAEVMQNCVTVYNDALEKSKQEKIEAPKVEEKKDE